jgi:hypothetical protein
MALKMSIVNTVDNNLQDHKTTWRHNPEDQNPYFTRSFGVHRQEAKNVRKGKCWSQVLTELEVQNTVHFTSC